MAQITWRNINAPNFSASNNLVAQGNNRIGNAFSRLKGLADQQVQREAQDAKLLREQEAVNRGIAQQEFQNEQVLNVAAALAGQREFTNNLSTKKFTETQKQHAFGNTLNRDRFTETQKQHGIANALNRDRFTETQKQHAVLNQYNNNRLALSAREHNANNAHRSKVFNRQQARLAKAESKDNVNNAIFDRVIADFNDTGDYKTAAQLLHQNISDPTALQNSMARLNGIANPVNPVTAAAAAATNAAQKYRDGQAAKKAELDTKVTVQKLKNASKEKIAADELKSGNGGGSKGSRTIFDKEFYKQADFDAQDRTLFKRAQNNLRTLKIGGKDLPLTQQEQDAVLGNMVDGSSVDLGSTPNNELKRILIRNYKFTPSEAEQYLNSDDSALNVGPKSLTGGNTRILFR